MGVKLEQIEKEGKYNTSIYPVFFLYTSAKIRLEEA